MLPFSIARRSIGPLALLVLAACGGEEQAVPPADPAAGEVPQKRVVHVPPSLPSGPVPLVVYVHGCGQVAEEAIAGVRWNELADAHGFIVVYPEQVPFTIEPGNSGEPPTTYGNDAQCWNWFMPGHMQRGAGEPAAIAAITREVMAQHDIDPERVYLMGISAGGIMASTMGATYPDLYAAIAIMAGGPYLYSDFSGALAANAMGEFARPLPVVVFHGTADPVVQFPMGIATVHQWLGTADLLDDGLANASVSPTPATTEHHGLDASVLSGVGTLGDPCIGGTTALPCLGGLLGLPESYPYSIEHYGDAAGRSLLDFWIIHGLGHAYPGGDRAGTYTDPLGPDVTTAAYEFFLAHPMPPQGALP